MMKPKKNPKKDLNQNRGTYFAIGLVLALSITIVALEWKTYDRYDYTGTAMNVEDDMLEDVPITVHLKIPSPPPPVQAPPVIEIAGDDEDVEETVIESTEADQEDEIKYEEIEVEEIEEPEEISFVVIEDVPVFPGCENEKDKRACFQEMMKKHIAKNFRYPELAQEMGIQGRVNTIFTIQKDGTIGNIRMRGPDKMLEEEAMRIIEKLPRMQPGKQRGTPVKVPFSIPINFRLQ